jgi:hypothetical protein
MGGFAFLDHEKFLSKVLSAQKRKGAAKTVGSSSSPKRRHGFERHFRRENSYQRFSPLEGSTARGGKVPPHWQRMSSGSAHPEAHPAASPSSLLGQNKTRVLRYQTVKILQSNAQSLTNDKIESLISHMQSENFDIALLQETKRLTDIMEVHGYRMFFYGGGNPETPGKELRAGVAIVLGPRAIAAWKEAGMPDPTLFPPTAKAARAMSLDLIFKDFRGRPIQMHCVSAHLPHSNYSNSDYQECLH